MMALLGDGTARAPVPARGETLGAHGVWVGHALTCASQSLTMSRRAWQDAPRLEGWYPVDLHRHVAIWAGAAPMSFPMPPLWILLATGGAAIALIMVVALLRFGTSERLIGGTDDLRDLSATAVRGYALAQVEVGRVPAAVTTIRAHLMRVATDVYLRAVLAAALLQRGEAAGAAEEFVRTLHIAQTADPDRPPYPQAFIATVNAALAAALQALGRAREADEHRRAAQAADAHILQATPAELYALLADFARDDELERRAFEDLPRWEAGRAPVTPYGIEYGPDAEPLYRAAVAANPRHARLRGDHAVALHAVGRHDAAARQFAHALRLAPSDAWLHFHQGTFYWRLGQLAEAEQELQAAAQLAPRSPGIRGTAAVFCLHQQRYDEARTELLAALNARPDISALARLYGTIELRAGRLEQAARAFEEADRRGSGDTAFRLVFGEVLERLGNLEGAAEQYRNAVRHEPSSGAAHVRYGAFLMRQGRFIDGERILREATALEGAEDAHLHLARLLLLERRLHEVHSHIESGLRLSPSSPALTACMAEWLLLRGQTAEAERLAGRALDGPNPDASVLLVRGAALLALDRQLEAQAALRDAVRVNPRLPEQMLFQARALAGNGFEAAALDHLGMALLLRPDWPEGIAERDRLAQMLAGRQRGTKRLS
jgi:tetratricopeptide (TPR) repeat protein